MPHLCELLFRGLYPPICDGSHQAGIWFGNYMRTYIERDVRQMINVRDLSAFQRFVRMCAGRTGQLTNLSALANDCGVTHNTAKAWLSVLEASYIVHLLQPHHRNFEKRLVKTPKLYFCDTGLACWLLGIRAPGQLDRHAQRGALFETWAVGELLKARYNMGLESNLYFWRDRTGNEVDVVIEEGDNLVPVEIKAGQTVSSDYFRGLERWQGLAKKASGKAWLLYGGDKGQSRLGCNVVPWAEIGSFASQLAADAAK
jgi:predicted AAA+ superfamily ATPase